MMVMRGSVAIWVPDGDISADETMASREAFEEALRRHATHVVISIDDGRRITFTRIVIRLPIFIESAEAEEAEAMSRALTERANRSPLN